jgi:uncharacterized membrane protein YhaH (DUF805 family)
MGFLHLLFGFGGRINRAKYWGAVVLWIVFWILAAIVILVAALGILGVNLTNGSLPGSDQPEKIVKLILDYVVLFIVFAVVAIASWVSGLAIGVKRLHDRDKSGWWIVLFYVVPQFLAGGGNQSEGGTAGILGLISAVLSIWGLVELGFLRGTRGPNRFGPDPLQVPGAVQQAPGLAPSP